MASTDGTLYPAVFCDGYQPNEFGDGIGVETKVGSDWHLATFAASSSGNTTVTPKEDLGAQSTIVSAAAWKLWGAQAVWRSAELSAPFVLV